MRRSIVTALGVDHGGDAALLAALAGWMPLLAAAFLVAGIAGFFVSAKLGLVALGVPVLLLLVLAPHVAILLVVAALPFDAVASLGPPGTLTLTRLVGIGVMAGWIVHLLVRRERVALARPAALLAAYVVFAGVSLLWSEDRASGLVVLRQMVQLLALSVMVANLLPTWTSLRRALDVLLLSSVAAAALVLWQLPAMGGIERATLRLGEEAFNPNALAAALVVPAFAGIALARSRGGWWRVGAVVPLVVAAFLTGSRGAMLALAVGAVIYLVCRPQALLRLGAAALAAVLLAMAFVPSGHLDAAARRFGTADEDRGSGRLDIWRVGVHMIEQRPLHGVGLAGFQPSFYGHMSGVAVDPHWAREWRNRYGNRGAHNTFLQAVAELGVIGGALLVAALGAHAWGARRALRRARRVRDGLARDVSVAVLCMLGVLVTLAFSGDLMVAKTPWVLLGLAQAVVLRSRVARPAHSPVTQAPVGASWRMEAA